MAEPTSAAVAPSPAAAAVDDPATAATTAPVDTVTSTPATEDNSLIDAAMSLWLGFRQRMYLQLQLLTLETQRAAQSLVNLLILACLIAALVISCWVGLLAIGILLLTSAGLSILAAVSCMVVLNLIALMFCLKLVRVQSCYLCFPATVAMLKPNPRQPDQSTSTSSEQSTDA